jgi:serine/threonine protein kinase
MYCAWWTTSNSALGGRRFCIAFEMLGAELFTLAEERGRRGERFSEREVRDVAHVLLRVSQYLHHTLKIVHRDIKLENILLCRPGAMHAEPRGSVRARRRSLPALDCARRGSSSSSSSDEELVELRSRTRTAAFSSSSSSEEEEEAEADSAGADATLTLPYFDNGSIAIKLCDFGAATELPAPPGGVGSFAGTPNYLAPEMVAQWARLHCERERAGEGAANARTSAGEGGRDGWDGLDGGGWQCAAYDERVDVWSIGACVHVLLSGKPLRPYAGLVDSAWREAQPSGEVPCESWADFSAQLLCFPAWNARASLSAGARAFTASLLEPKYERRPRASEALRHEWISRAAPSVVPNAAAVAALPTAALEHDEATAEEGGVLARGYVEFRRVAPHLEVWRRRFATLRGARLLLSTGPKRAPHFAIQLSACSAVETLLVLDRGGAGGEGNRAAAEAEAKVERTERALRLAPAPGGAAHRPRHCFTLTEAAGTAGSESDALSAFELARYELHAPSEAERDVWFRHVHAAVALANARD